MEVQLALSKYRFERLLLCVGEQVAIATSHFLGRMPNPFVNYSLVNPLGSAVAAKRVAKGMPAAKVLEPASLERGPEMVVALVDRDFSSG